MQTRLFGVMDIVVAGRHMQRSHGRRGRLLLVYLLLNQEHPATWEMLADVFWPEAPPASAPTISEARALKQDPPVYQLAEPQGP